jgi:16S rRNA processing protein RimM
MTQSWEDMALVGRIARAHGNRGQVVVDPETDFPEERFQPGAVLQIRRGNETRAVTVEQVRFHRGRPIVSLAGIGTMDEAEALAGSELRIDVDALHPLPTGAFYHHDLVGCMVETSSGESIGEVTGIEGDTWASRLIVQGKNGEILIPMAEGICVNIEVARRKIIVEPPAGLLDLNVTKRQRF